MFTGIIKYTGEILRNSNAEIKISASEVAKEVVLGSSVSVNGVCLTVRKKDTKNLFFDLLPETLLSSSLGSLMAGDKVHLETSLRIGDEIGGHFVFGHIDGVGELKKREKIGEAETFSFIIPKEISRYFAPKGSVAINGVSLTVLSCEKNVLKVQLVKHTLLTTLFGEMKIGTKVNIEVDMLARYAKI